MKRLYNLYNDGHEPFGKGGLGYHPSGRGLEYDEDHDEWIDNKNDDRNIIIRKSGQKIKQTIPYDMNDIYYNGLFDYVKQLSDDKDEDEKLRYESFKSTKPIYSGIIKEITTETPLEVVSSTRVAQIKIGNVPITDSSGEIDFDIIDTIPDETLLTWIQTLPEQLSEVRYKDTNELIPKTNTDRLILFINSNPTLNGYNEIKTGYDTINGTSSFYKDVKMINTKYKKNINILNELKDYTTDPVIKSECLKQINDINLKKNKTSTETTEIDTTGALIKTSTKNISKTVNANPKSSVKNKKKSETDVDDVNNLLIEHIDAYPSFYINTMDNSKAIKYERTLCDKSQEIFKTPYMVNSKDLLPEIYSKTYTELGVTKLNDDIMSTTSDIERVNIILKYKKDNKIPNEIKIEYNDDGLILGGISESQYCHDGIYIPKDKDSTGTIAEFKFYDSINYES